MSTKNPIRTMPDVLVALKTLRDKINNWKINGGGILDTLDGIADEVEEVCAEQDVAANTEDTEQLQRMMNALAEKVMGEQSIDLEEAAKAAINAFHPPQRAKT